MQKNLKVDTPPVSVLMCVHNQERYLSLAIESILNQTFTQFEFVIVDDGSTDNTPNIIKPYSRKDKRIKLITNDKNNGIARSVSEGLKFCNGKYIARMDSDDICLPNRLEYQFNFLESHPEIDVLGTGFDFLDETGKKTGHFVIRSTDPMVTRYEMLYHCVLHNPTTMSRAVLYKRFNENKLEQRFVANSDYAFWLRTSFDYRFSNLPERLLLYRVHDSQISHTNLSPQRETAVTVAREAFEKILGTPIPRQVIQAFYFSKRFSEATPEDVNAGMRVMLKAHRWFEKQNPLNRTQKAAIRKFTYEKVRSFLMKNDKSFLTLISGMANLFFLQPIYFLKDGWQKFANKVSSPMETVNE